jgi:sensor histidine kinase YesM
MKNTSASIHEIFVHVIIWILIITLPYIFLSEIFEPDTGGKQWHFWYPILQFTLAFYLNYCILIDKLLFRKKLFLFVIINVLIVSVFRFDWMIYHFVFQNDVGSLAEKSLHHKQDMHGINHKANPFSILHDVLVFLVPAGAAICIKAIQYQKKEEDKKKEIANKSLEAELQHLKYQLQPHFFFNALNNIYALVETSPEKAQQTIHKLGKMMRYLLYDAEKEKVNLSEEVDFIEKYIQLMQLKQNKNVTIKYNFPESWNKDYPIAPLLLIPLVENVFKHGISAIQTSSLLFEISLSNNDIIFKSSNGNHPKNQSDKSGSGIGLDNLKKRLELIYPEQHTFSYGISGSEFVTCLAIKLEY